MKRLKRTALGHHPCSIARALDVAGEWWTPLILRDVAHGVRRFREIQADLEISANVLSDRLESLVADGLLEPRVYQLRPERHEYYLTEKGLGLVPALLALLHWGDRWMWPGGRGPVRVTHDGCGEEVTVEIRCARCQRPVNPTELRATPRDGFESRAHEGGPGSTLNSHLRAAEDGVRIGP